MNMDWNSIKDVVATAAPILGTLVGGPGGTAVGTLIATVLGSENTPEAVAEILTDPAKVLELKKWAMKHKETLADMEMQTLQLELGDKANARKEHKHSYMPSTITIALTIMVASLGYLLFTVPLPVDNKDVAYILFGQITALWGASVTYWVGTTRSSAVKTYLLKG